MRPDNSKSRSSHRVRAACRMACLVAMLGIWTRCSPPAEGAAATTELTQSEQPSIRVVKAYCGIRCLYAAALTEGVGFPGADLVRPQYIGSREGSSIDELELAARDHGLHTFAFVNGTVGTLQLASHPVILHVESVPGSGRFDHFVLYLGARDNDLLVLDTTIAPGAPAQVVSPHELELMWDGAGLIVSKAPIERAVFATSWEQLLVCGGVLICVLASGKLFLMQRPAGILHPSASLGVAVEVLAIVTLALIAPSVSALCVNSGLLAHRSQVELVEQTHASYFLPRVSIAQAQKRLAAGSAVFVDARYASDYGSGHIPGALNVPVTARVEMVPLYMRAVRKDAPVIVYCQSKSCPFSKSVATLLLQGGYRSVELLDGGWEEWSAWKH